ncbi:hypothetical protein [Nitrococcus mobilis]|uniref:Uncharacterized protein n=1 Tax=Nitrococcus mobilis Nb-231 TaxID=314278 RepID=A4BU32_9GAMM|nr:hypothetical protein [Nitrococcus mobilis]EAR20706.1 hypothetical protein NB231_12486 [Nitrococcus mobilis Nb-231]
MKTKGHKDIASFFSVEVIKDTAKQLQIAAQPNTQAMLIANWLTDMAQIVIPVFGANQAVAGWIRGAVDSFFNLVFAIFLDDGRGQFVLDSIAKQLHRIGDTDTLKEIFDDWTSHLNDATQQTLDRLRQEIEDLGCDSEFLPDAKVDKTDTALELIETIREQACRQLLGRTRDLEELPDDLRQQLQRIEEQLQPLFSRLTDLANQLELINLDDIQSRLEAFRLQVHASVDAIFPDNHRRAGEINELFKSMVALIGYFKFVHPEERGKAPRLPYYVYKAIVDEHYVAGWTYMHLDRALDAKGPSPYRAENTQAAETAYGIYDYLREDLKIIISRLYEVERDWAIPFFELGEHRIGELSKQAPPVSDPNYFWHMGLAKLGATLHAVQDFFAHTNFVEHAIRSDWKRRTKFLTNRQKSLIFKRLHRWEHQPQRGRRKSWKDFPEETNLVSGYFDCMDTAVVFFHVLFDFLAQIEDAFETENFDKALSDTLETADKFISDPWAEVKRKLGEVVEIIEDPKKAVEDITNETAQKHKDLLDSYGITKQPKPPADVDKQLVKDLLRDSHLFRDADPEVLEHAINTIQLIHFAISGRRLLFQYIKLARDIINLVKLGRKFRRAPRLVLRDVPEKVIEKLADYVRKVLVHEVERHFLQIIGSERLGSHSLLSKDDDAALLYKEGLHLAMFVDAYIVSLMIRAPHDPDDHRFKSPRTAQVTKWEDVIDHFLNHPIANYEVTTTTPVRFLDDFLIHVDPQRQPNSLLTLARHFKRNAEIPTEYKRRPQQPHGYIRYDWKVVADANFPTWGLSEEQTKYVVNQILSTPGAQHPLAGRGFPVKDGINYAFKNGTPVVIPFQIVECTLLDVAFEDRVWWMAVLDLDDLRKMRELFRKWRKDSDNVPFGLVFEPGRHAFDLEDPAGGRALTEFLAREIQVGQAIRERREEEERSVRMKGSMIQCFFDSIGNRAIH